MNYSMKYMKMLPRVLAAKISMIFSFLALMICMPANAGIPVIDGTNVIQTTISAINNVASVQKQIQQYTTELQQYENMLKNTVVPSEYIWSNASSTIYKLLEAQDAINYYKNQTGSIDNYLKRYQDINYYRSSECFSSNFQCTSEDLDSIKTKEYESSEARKKANDAVLKTVDKQQSTLQSDADSLVDLQNQASSAQGQMEAIQAANQLGSAQASQLLQIRSLLVAQQNAAGTLAQAQADKEAQRAAGSISARSGDNITSSTSKNWSFN